MDDLTFIFQIQNIPEYSGDNVYEQLSKEMVHSWVTFAKTGQPAKIDGKEWTESFPSTIGRKNNVVKGLTMTRRQNDVPVPQYLKIKIGSTAMVDEPFNDGIRFWNSLNLDVYRRSKDDSHELISE